LSGEAPSSRKLQAVGYWFLRASGAWQRRASILPPTGPAIGQPLIGLSVAAVRLAVSFVSFISLIYFGLFYWIYRNPSEDRSVTEQEREFIGRWRAQPERTGKAGKRDPALDLLRQRK